MLQRISASRAIRELTENMTVFVYLHKSARNMGEDNLTESQIELLLANVTPEKLTECEHRTATPKSWGVRFHTGSELRLYGQKGKTDCFKFEFDWIHGVYVDCGFAAMIYIIDNL